MNRMSLVWVHLSRSAARSIARLSMIPWDLVVSIYPTTMRFFPDADDQGYDVRALCRTEGRGNAAAAAQRHAPGWYIAVFAKKPI